MLWLVVVLMAVAFLSWIFLVSPSQKRKAPRRPILHIDVPSFGTMRSLEPEDFDEAALCMALAFCDSPWYTFIFQDQKERQVRERVLQGRSRADKNDVSLLLFFSFCYLFKERIKALCFLFTRNMSLMYQKDPHALLGLRDGSGFVCCFILANPKVRQVSKLELVQSGILKLAWYFGVGAMMRISSVVDFLGEAERAVVANAMQGFFVFQRIVLFSLRKVVGGEKVGSCNEW